MSEFRNLVESILKENRKDKIKEWLRATTTPEHIYHIFHLDEELDEDKDETKNSLWLANNIYKQILDKINKKDYEKTKFGGIVTLDNPELEIEFSITGRKGDGFYSKEDDKIIVYVEDINTFSEDENLEASLIHEIAHSMSYDDMNNYYNYISPENNREKYLTQPLEFEANKVALCNMIINKTLKTLKDEINKDEIDNSELLRKHIDAILYKISQDEKNHFNEFLKTVHKDKKAFQEMYFEIIVVCIEYIQEHLTESHNWALTNECRKINIHDLPDLTLEEAFERLYESLDKLKAEIKERERKKDYIKEFKESCEQLKNKIEE